MLYRKYIFGDTAAYYVQTQGFGTGLCLLPVSVSADPDELSCDSMVQVSLRGAYNLVDYTQGVTMRNMSSVLLTIAEQRREGDTVVTRLADGQGNEYIHTLAYDAATGVFCIFVEYQNHTGKEQVLESLQSFSVSGIFAPSAGRITDEGLKLVRMTSAWSRECRLKEDEFCNLGLDMSWGRYGIKAERFGQVGSMPNRGWYPFAALRDEGSGFILAATIEAPYSWQMEVYKEKETCALSGGLADREFGHWYKRIGAGESFCTHRAFVRVRFGSLEDACNDLLRYQDARLRLPASEENMPVLFNEYCTTWGVPSEENIASILRAVEGIPFDYFVIDCGWYKPDDCGWCNATGDWEQNKELFPRGIGAVAQMIRSRGMLPGLWFEFEVAGRDSKAFHKEDMLLTRDGVTLTSKNRRFFDLRKPAVQAYIEEKMCDFLRENGFGYIKIDYNDNYGMGCDGAESLGEAGRQVAEESLSWLDRLEAAVPGIVIENCSSGGSRIEPLRMSKVSMCSFSDAHECNEIPLVAANVSRVVPARQSQIWAVIREGDSIDRIVWSMTAAMFGRICVSGDVHKIGAAQKAKIREGIEFYNAVKEVVRTGSIAEIYCDVKYYRDPHGCQLYKKVSADGRRMLLLAHFFRRPYARAEADVSGWRLAGAYTTLDFSLQGGALRFSPKSEYTAGAFLFEKSE